MQQKTPKPLRYLWGIAMMTRIVLENHLNCVGRTIPWEGTLECKKQSRGIEHWYVGMHSLLSSWNWRHKFLPSCLPCHDGPHYEVIKLFCEVFYHNSCLLHPLQCLPTQELSGDSPDSVSYLTTGGLTLQIDTVTYSFLFGLWRSELRLSGFWQIFSPTVPSPSPGL